jgi:aspartate racemase
MGNIMKTVGIVGGLGPESTIDYYRSIISVYRRKVADRSYPSIVIISLDVDKALRLVTAHDLQQLADYFAGSVRRLADAGADFALLSANTPHIVFHEVCRLSPLPLLSIVEATCEEVARRGLKRVSLLGTRFTMSGRFYPESCEKHGIVLVPPSPEEQAYIHDKYVNELVNGIFLPETRDRLQQIIAIQKQRDRIEGVILAGTELPLLLRAESLEGLPILDTTQIHVNAAVSEMLSNQENRAT